MKKIIVGMVSVSVLGLLSFAGQANDNAEKTAATLVNKMVQKQPLKPDDFLNIKTTCSEVGAQTAQKIVDKADEYGRDRWRNDDPANTKNAHIIKSQCVVGQGLKSDH